MRDEGPTSDVRRRWLRTGAIAALLFLLGVAIGRMVYFQPGAFHEEAGYLANRLRWPTRYDDVETIIEQLKAIGDPAIPVVIDRLREPHGDEYFIKKALLAFGEPAIEPLIRFVEKGDLSRFEITWKLWPRLPEWMKLRLRNPGSESQNKRHAFELLTAIAPESEEVFALLERGAEHPYESCRGAAIRSMRLLHPKFADRILPLVIEARNDPSVVVRLQAAVTLKTVIGDSRPDEEALIAFLRDPDPTVRRYVADALSRYRNPGPRLVSALRKGLADKDPPCRVYFAKACWKIEALKELALEVWRQNLRHEREPIWTLFAVEDLDPPPLELVRDIEGLLKHEQRPVRLWAAISRYRLTKDAASAVKDFSLMIRDGDGFAKEETLRAIQMLGLERETPLPLILELIQWNVVPETRIEAIRVFGKMGQRARGHLDLIDDALTDDWVKLQEAAYEARRSILEGEAPAIPSRKAGSDP